MKNDAAQHPSSPPRALRPERRETLAAAEVNSPRRALFHPPNCWPNCPDPAADQIIVARPTHAKMIFDLQRKFSNQLGFIPGAATEWYIASGNVAVAYQNGEPCGMLLGRPRFRYQPLMRPITQAAVYMDAQRRHHGLALLAALEARALKEGQLALQCCCAEDQSANEFWATAGFVPVDLLLPDNARKRGIIVWRKQLTNTQPEWFLTPPPRSGHKARSTRFPT